MKYRLATIIALCLLCEAAAQNKTIILAADEWAPFNMTPQSREEGYMVDIARAIYEPLGYTLEYRIVPWNRTLIGTKEGLYNGAIGASKADASGFVFPEEELAINRLGFFVLASSTWRFTGKDSLLSQRLGVIDGYDYREWLSEYIATHRLDPTRIQIMTGAIPLEKNVQKLLFHRIDAVVDSTTALRYTAKKMGVQNKIINAGEDTEPAYIYIAFSPSRPDSQKLADLLTEGIRKLRKTGQLSTILAKYGLEDWK